MAASGTVPPKAFGAQRGARVRSDQFASPCRLHHRRGAQRKGGDMRATVIVRWLAHYHPRVDELLHQLAGIGEQVEPRSSARHIHVGRANIRTVDRTVTYRA